MAAPSQVLYVHSPAQRTTMTIESELSGLNRELSIFPERAFDFKNAGAVIIEQVSYFLFHFPLLLFLCYTYLFKFNTARHQTRQLTGSVDEYPPVSRYCLYS